MAYFLRQEKKKKGLYLQMYDSYWDKEMKQSRTKNVMAFGYVEASPQPLLKGRNSQLQGILPI